MAASRRGPLDAEMLAETILAGCLDPEDGRLGTVLRDSLRAGAGIAREAIGRPDVRMALALRVSTTDEECHGHTAMLLRALRQVDAASAAAIVQECDVAALARSLSYACEYTAHQASLLGRLYACDPAVGRQVFRRCGGLFREFMARSAFAYLDLPEELMSDVKRYEKS